MNVSSRLLKTILKTGGIILALALLVCAVGPAAAAPQYLAVQKVYVTNVREGEFTVSWTTTEPSNAIVRYGTTTALGSSRSDPVSGIYTHHVVVDSLLPDVTYYFEVQSGTVTDNNGGSYYTTRTAPLLAETPPFPAAAVWGMVYLADGSTPVPYALVYLRVIDADGQPTAGNSQWISARADDTGMWFYYLGTDRSENLSRYYEYTADEDLIQLAWQGGPAGTVGAPGSEYYDFVPGVDTQIDVDLDGQPTAITSIGFSASSQAPAGQWQVGLLAALLLAMMALMGLQMRLAARQA